MKLGIGKATAAVMGVMMSVIPEGALAGQGQVVFYPKGATQIYTCVEDSCYSSAQELQLSAYHVFGTVEATGLGSKIPGRSMFPKNAYLNPGTAGAACFRVAKRAVKEKRRILIAGDVLCKKYYDSCMGNPDCVAMDYFVNPIEVCEFASLTKCVLR